jgi:hypothetical protein
MLASEGLAAIASRSERVEMRSAEPADCTMVSLGERSSPKTIPAHPFTTDHADLDPVALRRRADDGDKSVFNEIDMADHLARRLQDLADIEFDRFNVRCEAVAVSR